MKKDTLFTHSAQAIKGLFKAKKTAGAKEGSLKALKQCGMIKIPLSCLETSTKIIRRGSSKPKKRVLKATIAKEALRYALFAVLRGVLRKTFAEEHILKAKRVTPAPGQKSILAWKNKRAVSSSALEGELSLKKAHAISTYSEEPLFEEGEVDEYNQWEDAIKTRADRQFNIGRITRYLSD